MTPYLPLSGRRHAILCLLCLSFALCGPGPVMAQTAMAGAAEETCQRPPMDLSGLDRIRRQGDYARLLEALADRCPEVALVFQEFQVGRVAGQSVQRREVRAPFPPLGWPRPAGPGF